VIVDGVTRIPESSDLNDYSALEARYRAATGHELVGDPHDSIRHHPPLTLSASIVIPAWNAGATLERCLTAIALSSFNRRYPDRLEVVVVDDGSTDGTWDLLKRLEPGVRLTALRQRHGHSRARAQNTALAVAGGDVVMTCDADILLAPFAIEELIKRHEFIGQAMFLGFYPTIEADDPRIARDALTDRSPLSPPLLWGDPRFLIGPAWPESVCRDSHHLKRLGGDRVIVSSGGNRWPLPHVVYGGLFSLLRSDWRAIDGYDERFVGWGSEDTLVGARAETLGIPLIPVYSAVGWHIAHPPRSGTRKRHEARTNLRRLEAARREPFAPRHGENIDRAIGRVVGRIERAGDGRPRFAVCDEAAIAPYDAMYADPLARGDYLHALGRYEEAALAYADVPGADARSTTSLIRRARSLRLAGHADSALALLGDLPVSIDDATAHLERALALADRGSMAEARYLLARARRAMPAEPTIDYIVGQSATHHRWRGDIYAQQGDHELAVRDYEAALIADNQDAATWAARARSRAACARSTDRTEFRPLPSPARIVAAGQAIPGRLLPDEAELLVALTLSVAAWCDRDEPPLFVVASPGCGRAMVTMGLALCAIERDDARIIVAAPDIEPAPDGRTTRDVLTEALSSYNLGDIVAFSRVNDAASLTRRSHLVLVGGGPDARWARDCLARYATNLVTGGYLVLHDGGDCGPDFQAIVDDLLAADDYRLVARVQGLLALATISATPVPPTDDEVMTISPGLR
jgi:GT2 family glycosyltransferase